jgi:TonB-linked SusC/RagA family outer membrane protein
MRKFFTKQYLLICAFLMLTTVSFAQTAVITGKVSDETNQPLPGAVVTVKGTRNGAPADVQGNFKLSGVSYGTVTLQITFIGYQSLEKTVTVAGNMTVNFSVVPSLRDLNEVVVIGYGSVQKKDLTGAVTNVTAKDFNTGAITTPEQLIQGKVAGVSITSNGGAPGSGSVIRIRGGASINGGSDPLIVIDGVPLSSGGIAGAANPLDLINPNDIESFSVLKDASAAAIYGNRGSNGVIIITTKKGQAGKPKFNFSTQFSVAKLPKEAPILTAAQFRAYVTSQDTTSSRQYASLLGSANTDWQSQIYQTSYSTDNNFSVSGSAGLLPYRVSIGYTDQNGILKTSALKRYSTNINLTPSLFTDHLKVNFNFIGTNVRQRFTPGAIGAANSFNPTLPVYSGNNNFGGYFELLDPTATDGLKSLAPLNPLGLLNSETNVSSAYRAITSLALDYKFHFFPDLHAVVNISYDGSNGQGTDNIDPNAASQYPGVNDANGVLQRGNSSNYKTVQGNATYEGDLTYSHDFKSIKSKVTALVGYSEQDFSSTSTNYRSYFANGEVKPASAFNFPYSLNQHDLSSVYGRVTYSYNEKFLLAGSIRSDISTKFAPGIRTGNFPAGSAAWVISREDFLKGSNVISNLKLRVGYGVTGNEAALASYDYLSDYSLGNTGAQYQLGNTFYQVFRPGAFYFGRTWEQSATTNAAIDFGFLNERITGSLDFYYQKTSRLLAQIGQPAGDNFSNTIVGNVGNMEEKGIELNINARVIDTKDITWNVGFNATVNRNQITNLSLIPNPNFPGLATNGISGGIGQQIGINQIGYPQNSFYVLQAVYGANGKPLQSVFVDKNHDGIINNADLSIEHSPAPQAFFGINSDIRVKKWNAGFVARASIGNYVYNNLASSTGIQRNFLNPLGILYNGSSNVLESGLTGNGGNDVLSDYYVQNASYFRMDNVHIGYDFGKVIKGAGNLRISGNVQNVFVITNYTGVDPEVFSGVDNNQYPRPRTFVLGLNLSL